MPVPAAHATTCMPAPAAHIASSMPMLLVLPHAHTSAAGPAHLSCALYAEPLLPCREEISYYDVPGPDQSASLTFHSKIMSRAREALQSPDFFADLRDFMSTGSYEMVTRSMYLRELEPVFISDRCVKSSRGHGLGKRSRVPGLLPRPKASCRGITQASHWNGRTEGSAGLPGARLPQSSTTHAAIAHTACVMSAPQTPPLCCLPLQSGGGACQPRVP